MKNIKSRIPTTLLILILLGLVIQVGGCYLVDAFCIGIPLLGDKVPYFVRKEIADYTVTITDLTSMESRMVVYVILAAPMIEELVFRVLFLQIFAKFLPFWIANLLQAILFGIYHMGLVQGLYAFLIGTAIGAVFYYVRSSLAEKKSLIAPLGGYVAGLVLHGVINASGLYLAPVLPDELTLSNKIIIGVSCTVVTISVLVLFLRPAKRKS